jgi:serine/threonine protein kinase
MFIGKKFGRFEAQSIIGKGGMGEVYEGFDTELNRQVAIKVLTGEFSKDEGRKKRFRQEALATSALNHPNIITIFEIGENEHGSFLVTELIKGKTLRDIIKSESLPITKILKITEQIGQALAAAHQEKIIHRDIKPENIIVREDGIAKILDFGLAKPISQELDSFDDDAELVKTVPGVVMGSVRYMSPEQARGVKIDERSDIWSLGIILYEMLTKRTPFKGTTTSDTIADLIHKDPDPLSKYVSALPVRLQQITDKALQKDPTERYQKAEDFVRDIRELLYDIEHEVSIEKMNAISRDVYPSENPTMIHQTSSANHPTIIHNNSTRETSNVPVEQKAKSNPFKLALFTLIAFIVIGGLGYVSYLWLTGNSSLAISSFNEVSISRISTDGNVFSPAISPDEKYVTYVSGETGNHSLVVRQVSTDSIVTLIKPQERNLFGPTFSPEGDYIYYLQTSKDFVINTLYRIPTLGGEPKKIIEDVDSDVTFSPDGKKLVFHRNVSKDATVLIMTADINGSNVETLLSSTDTEFNIVSNPKWSPQGDVILVRAFNNFGGIVDKIGIGIISLADKKLKIFDSKKWNRVNDLHWLKDGSGFLLSARENEDSSYQIWQTSYPQGQIKSITNDINNYFNFDLSADGKTIVAFKGDSSSSVWSFEPATKESKQILSENRNAQGNGGFVETPEGKFIYTRRDGKTISIWSMNKDFSNQQKLSNELETAYSLTLTPDGQNIIFGSRKSGTARIWRMGIDGENLTQLTQEREKFGDFTPQVTPDGKTVIFQEYASGANAETAFKKVSVEGGESSVSYENDKFSVYGNLISPDGKYVAYTSYRKTDYEKTVRIIQFNEDKTFGELVKEFDADSVNNYIWTPDGKSLTFVSNRSGTPNLWQLPIENGDPKPLTNFTSGQIHNYNWSADGKKLYIVRGTVNNDLVLIQSENKSQN